MSDDTVKAICNGNNHKDLITTISMSLDVIPEELSSLGSPEHRNWRKLQDEDDPISLVRHSIQNSEKFDSDDLEAWKLWKQRRRLKVQDGILFRTCKLADRDVNQLVLPKASRLEVLKALHDDMGHFGFDRVWDLVKSRFYWPGMAEDVKSYVGGCLNCMKRKRWEPRAELVNIKTSYPMEMVSMDFLGLEASIGGHANILVLTDHFTRFAMATPTKNQTAKTTAKALIDLFITHYGLPHRLHSDNGTNFTSQVIREMCSMLGIQRSTTTVYHPSGNGQTEKFNKTLLDMLATLPEAKKNRWKEYVQPLVHAYNCTKNSVTGYSPFHLMFGREPRLPVDLKFGLVGKTEELSHKEFVEDLRTRLEEAYKIAASSISKAQKSAKKHYDQRVRGNKLQVGDRVLKRKTQFGEGKHKLSNRWDDKVYVVRKQLEGIPVYEIQPETGHGRSCRLHRNNLLPIEKKPDCPVSSDSSSEEDQYRLHLSPSDGELEDEAVAKGPPISEPKTNTPQRSKSESSSDSQVESPQRPLPRRSSRVRKQPERFQAGTYAHSAHLHQEKDKIHLLSQLLEFLNK